MSKSPSSSDYPRDPHSIAEELFMEGLTDDQRTFVHTYMRQCREELLAQVRARAKEGTAQEPEPPRTPTPAPAPHQPPVPLTLLLLAFDPGLEKDGMLVRLGQADEAAARIMDDPLTNTQEQVDEGIEAVATAQLGSEDCTAALLAVIPSHVHDPESMISALKWAYAEAGFYVGAAIGYRLSQTFGAEGLAMPRTATRQTAATTRVLRELEAILPQLDNTEAVELVAELTRQMLQAQRERSCSRPD